MRMLLAEGARLGRARRLLSLLLVLLALHAALGYHACEAGEIEENNAYFCSQLQALTERTGANLSMLEESAPTSFAAQYDRLVLSACERVSVLCGHLPPVRGWDAVLGYTGSHLLLLVGAVLLAVHIFCEDRAIGLQAVVRTTKKGRGRLALARLAWYFLLCLALSLAFTLTLIAAAGQRGELIGLRAPVQAFAAFVYAPYPITVWQALLVRTLLQGLLAAAMGLLVAALTLLLDHAPLAALLGALIYGTQQILVTRPNPGVASPLAHCNLIAAMDTAAAYRRLDCVDLGIGVAIPARLVVYLGTPMLLLLLAAAVYRLHLRPPRFSLRRRRAARTERWAIRRPIPKTTRCVPYCGLLGWEGRKLLYHKRLALLLLLLLLGKVGFVAADALANPLTRQERLYRDYMMQLGGPLDENTVQRIQKEQHRLEEATLLRGKLMHMEGLDEQELAVLWATIHEAAEREDAFALFYEQYRAVAEESDAARRGQMFLVYESGWMAALQGGYDFFSFLFLALLSSIVITQEREVGFEAILRTTARGRCSVRRAKLLHIALTVGLASLGMTLFDTAVCALRYSLPRPDAALISLAAYRDVPVTWTMGGYLAARICLRTLGATLLALILCLLSCRLGSGLVTLLLSVVAVPLPALALADSGLPWRPCDLLDGDALLHRGFASEPYRGVAVIVAYLLLLICLGLGERCARRQSPRRRRSSTSAV